MHVAAKLDTRTLERSLNAVYMGVANALTQNGAALTPDLVLGVIPGVVYCTAVEAGWIEPPSGPRAAVEAAQFTDGIDTYFVTPDERDEFFRLLDDAILFWKAELRADFQQYRAIAEECRSYVEGLNIPQPRYEPRPDELLQRWMDENEKVLEDLEHESGVSVATLSRLMNGKTRGKIENLKAVAEVIGIGPDNWIKLRWTPRALEMKKRAKAQ